MPREEIVDKNFGSNNIRPIIYLNVETHKNEMRRTFNSSYSVC